MEQSVRILEEHTCYEGFFKLVRYRLQHALFKGGWSAELIREVLERGQAAAVLPYDPKRDEVILIEQFRPGALSDANGAWLWEIVAGIVEPGESPQEVAEREALEEMGEAVTNLMHICTFFVSPGSTTETTALFCGQVNAERVGGIHGVASEYEDIQVHVLPFPKALAWIAEGKIRFAPAIIALQWLALHKQEVLENWGN